MYDTRLLGGRFLQNTKRNCPGTPPNRCRTELLSDERFGFVHDTIHICSRLSRRPSRIEASSKLKKRGTWAVTTKRNCPGTPPNRCRTELLSDERFGFVHDTIHICSRLSRRPSRIEASSKLKKRGTWAVTHKTN